MKQYSKLYKDELLNQVIPFWEKFSLDKINGGYFTCITESGEVFDTDKFVWLQARQVWMFSKLYKDNFANENWKQIAIHGADFLEKYGRDQQDDWYFSLTKNGTPLVEAYNIFSDCFASMAFGALYKIQPEKKYAEIAKSTFNNILKRQHNPKGKYNKRSANGRVLQNFALPMILCNLSSELEHLLEVKKVNEVTDSVINLIMEKFYHKESGLVLENISKKGGFVDSFEGRLINPGHAIEAMWFVMNQGFLKNDQALIEKAEKIMFDQLENGWDKEYGGIFYFMDFKGNPTEQLEWDQKLWWVHLETLVALAKSYQYNKSPRAKEWFEKVHNYTWNHFRDEKNGGEWYGYLNRKGEVSLHLKGGKWKGCFHVPRALLEISKTLE